MGAAVVVGSAVVVVVEGLDGEPVKPKAWFQARSTTAVAPRAATAIVDLRLRILRNLDIRLSLYWIDVIEHPYRWSIKANSYIDTENYLADDSQRLRRFFKGPCRVVQNVAVHVHAHVKPAIRQADWLALVVRRHIPIEVNDSKNRN